MLKTSRGPWALLILSVTWLAGCAVDDPYYYDDRRTDAPVYYRGRTTPHYVPVPYDDGRPRYHHEDRRPRVERYQPPPPPPPPRDRRDRDNHNEWNERHSARPEIRPHDQRRTEERPVRPPPPLRVVPKPKPKPNDSDNQNYHRNQEELPPRYRPKPYATNPNNAP